jgi:hypothetical protein
MTMNEFNGAHLGVLQPLPVHRSEHSWCGVLAALMTRLMNTWVGLYAPPPRRLGPLV